MDWGGLCIDKKSEIDNNEFITDGNGCYVEWKRGEYMRKKKTVPPLEVDAQALIDNLLPLITGRLKVVPKMMRGTTSASAFLIDEVFQLYPTILDERKMDRFKARVAQMRGLFGKKAKNCKGVEDFIDLLGLNKSTLYADRIFEDRQRPTKEAVKIVLEKAGVTDRAECEKYYHQFGYHLTLDTPEALKARILDVSREDVCNAARAMRLEAVYFLCNDKKSAEEQL